MSALPPNGGNYQALLDLLADWVVEDLFSESAARGTTVAPVGGSIDKGNAATASAAQLLPQDLPAHILDRLNSEGVHQVDKAVAEGQA
jgi:hypothetical protein